MDVYLHLCEHLVAAFWFHSHAAKLGAQLADMHLENKKLGERLRKEAGTVGKTFGPGGTLPRGGHLDLMGVWVGSCPSPLSGGQTCVDASGRECQPQDACLGRSELSTIHVP